MPDHSAAFRRCLIDLDIDGVGKLWQHVYPNLPQPGNRGEVLSLLHLARTAANSVPGNLRFYSHRWATDRNLPSQLPDHLRPKAERMYPQAAEAVGISANSKYPVVQEAIHDAMQYAVLETYADGHQSEAHIVRARMMEARDRERRGLGLR